MIARRARRGWLARWQRGSNVRPITDAHGPADATRTLLDRKRAAERGDPAACVALGLAFERGEGAIRSPADAVAWCERAAAAGCGEAQARLATLLLVGAASSPDHGFGETWLFPKGRSVAADPATARRWALRAAASGSAAGLVVAGYILARGLGGPADPQVAELLLRRAATAGLAEAECQLAMVLEGNPDDPGMRAEALGWYRRAAQQASPIAAFRLGVLYATGGADDPDVGVAARWFRTAAERDHLLAQINLARLLLRGIGVSRDCAGARAWLARAKAREPVAAATAEAELLAFFTDPPAPSEALSLLHRSAAAGDRRARDLLERLDAGALPRDAATNR